MLARLIVDRLLAPGAPIEVVVDDTLFRRWGPKVFGAFWTHDGSAQGPDAIGRGNRWVIVAIVVALPFCSHPVCLPVLLRLWRGKGTVSPVGLAGELITLLANEFRDRTIHAVGDAAYHGRPLLIAHTSFTTRLPVNAVLYAPAPPRTGDAAAPPEGPPVGHAGRDRRHRELAPRPGRALRPHRHRRGRRDPRHLVRRIRQPPGRTVLAREVGGQKALAIFTTDTDSPVETIVARYAHRWSIETAIAAGKQLLGIGQARNRLQRAVERTVPFSFCVYSLVVVWYALHGYHRDDLAARRATQPWYPHKDEPAFEDMLAKLRRTLVAARITGVHPAQPDPHKYRDYELACAAAAA